MSTFHLGLGVPFVKGIVMKNAIDPIPVSKINKPDPKDQIRLI